jgi:hypothetical protein
MYCLETLNLVQNPIVNQHPYLAMINSDESAISSALTRYFNGGGESPSSGSMGSNMGMTGGMQQK